MEFTTINWSINWNNWIINIWKRHHLHHIFLWSLNLASVLLYYIITLPGYINYHLDICTPEPFPTSSNQIIVIDYLIISSQIGYTLPFHRIYNTLFTIWWYISKLVRIKLLFLDCIWTVHWPCQYIVVFDLMLFH